MSTLQFIKDPFPDNHDGFDYSPKSFIDSQREITDSVASKENAKAQNKMMSMLASVFK